MHQMIMPIYGTRPEAIKMAPVIRALEQSEHLDPLVVSTGQHREMLDQVNQIFGIVPDINLDVMKHGQSLNHLLSRTVEQLDAVLRTNKPAAVVVQGDTTTVAAGAIASFYNSIPVVHVEAGLRSHNLLSPFPEEANRKLTTQVTTLHCAPTSTSKKNLIAEGIDSKDILVTGNTVIDALLETAKKEIPFSDQGIASFLNDGHDVMLVTVHRRENLGKAMKRIGKALKTIAKRFPQLKIVFPIHRNPLVRETILPEIGEHKNVLVTEPVDYGQFTTLLTRSKFVLTDSGGVQEEAPSLGKPVLVLRDNTERPEAVEAGTVSLIGTDEANIVDHVSQLILDPNLYEEMAQANNPYGDGQAAIRIVAGIEQMLGLGTRLPEFGE